MFLADIKKKVMWYLRVKSHEENYAKFVAMAEYNPFAKLLDIGCSTGVRTLNVAKRIGTQDIIGVDARNTEAPFEVVKQNVDTGLPFADGTFDVVTAHHIIEHVSDTDMMVSEMFRVLRYGGYALYGTPNLASGKTIVALILDRQPYDTFVSDYFIIGNRAKEDFSDWEMSEGFLHRRLFTMDGLTQLLMHYGFTIEYKKKIGYGRYIFGEILMGKYAANLVVKARKERK